ncbi:hypothetical protein HF888_11810 [Bermanella marisrubri]|uniref:Uncharacterized protein n=1 Tax=Bermanella marisrubri TaxID=207949 RepID=Q1N2T7_9GAMM|nr:hypothetical protein [Bermanella marisrubri]EAT12582.1 hypothetical protein RED65_06793 [Oceanobacter sp. RED65] [Bermanella marisrubri]QIZ84862.1 hypothetical protein HF888_11810 [Bermanella marisrubri]
MSRSAQQAVNDYLFSMFNDGIEESLNDLLNEPVDESIGAQDSIPADSRMTIAIDSFALAHDDGQDKCFRFLAYLTILNITCQLPPSRIKNYCLSHCQMLLARGAWHE